MTTHGGEDDLDRLNLALAVGDIGVWEVNTKTGQAWRNRRHDQIFGYPKKLSEWTVEQFLSHVVPEEKESVSKAYYAALASGGPWEFECKIRRADGQPRWVRASGRPVLGDDGQPERLVGFVIDITETRQREERLRLLTHELNHRVRNILAVLQSIMLLSARQARTVEELQVGYLGRLEALARTHDLFADSSGLAVRVRRILESEILPYSSAPGRFTISGDDTVAVEGREAESLSLLVHELVTNAVKHGALSSETGRIEIVVTRASDSKAHIRWREIDGPPVRPPERSGFGQTLLRSVLAGSGRVELDFAPDGLVADIDIPACTVQARQPLEAQTTLPELAGGLAGKRVLILEDEALIAMSLEMTLIEEGAQVVGPFARIEEALESLAERVDAAVLDVHLGPQSTREVAVQLTKLGVPFVFTTGDSTWESVTADFAAAPVLNKPVREQEVAAVLARLLADRA